MKGGVDTATVTAADAVGLPLVVQNLAKSYVSPGKVTPVVGDLSFTLAPGEIVAIVGPSGCGKTTLLNVVCGLIPADSGRVYWHGELFDPRGKRPANVGYMLQKDLLLPWRSAASPPSRRTSGRGRCSTNSACTASRRTIPRPCRAACVSAWPLPERS
jgi:ABC-type dipeptide/oligopeptide/nickel transport system ATPase component